MLKKFETFRYRVLKHLFWGFRFMYYMHINRASLCTTQRLFLTQGTHFLQRRLLTPIMLLFKNLTRALVWRAGNGAHRIWYVV